MHELARQTLRKEYELAQTIMNYGRQTQVCSGIRVYGPIKKGAWVYPYTSGPETEPGVIHFTCFLMDKP